MGDTGIGLVVEFSTTHIEPRPGPSGFSSAGTIYSSRIGVEWYNRTLKQLQRVLDAATGLCEPVIGVF